MSVFWALETSPFGRIPTELRLKIWEYAMHKQGLVRLSHFITTDEGTARINHSQETVSSSSPDVEGEELNVYDPDDIFKMDKRRCILSLTQTCQQIRSEAMPIFLESNSFHVPCPIFDNSKGHGEISSEATRKHRQEFRAWLQTLNNHDEKWSSCLKNLTIDLGIWRICGCKSSSKCFVDALIAFSADFPPQRNRTLKVQFRVQWRAICPCCEIDTNDESVWPLEFELERGNNDRFFEAVMEVCEGTGEVDSREGETLWEDEDGVVGAA